MSFYRNIFIATGTVAFAYMMLKLILSTSEKSLQLKESDKNVENDENASESKTKPVKRKLEDDKGAMKFPKFKPNYFIAFPVNDIGIHKKVKALQEKLIKENPLLFSAIVNVSTLHVTLAVTNLATEKDVNIVKSKLNEWAANNVKKYLEKPCVLNFNGVKTFNNAVAYVDMEHCENYNRIIDLSENINNLLSSAGYVTEKKRFTPHLTFLKLSRDIKLLKLKNKFKYNFKSLKDCKEHFGEQEVRYVQLLSMEPRDNSGYYKCVHQIKITNADEPEMDHSECCTPLVNPKKPVKK